MPRALVLVHLEREGLGSLGPWLRGAGLDLDVRRLHAGDPVPERLPGDCAALVVMGGAMGVGDADRLPWLRDEIDLVRRTAQDGAPVLGVCLGAQLLAAGCGGTVAVGSAGPEIGAAEVDLGPCAADDALLAGVEAPAPVVQWHFDAVVDLPPGAVALASSAAYPHQAFRVGERAWGIQFHVETTPDMVRPWAAADAARLAEVGVDAHARAERAGELTPALAATWRPVAERFAALAGR